MNLKAATAVLSFLAAFAAGGASALENAPIGENLGSFVRGRTNALQIAPGEEWGSVGVGSAARELRLSAPGTGDAGLITFTPSFSFRGAAAGLGGGYSTTLATPAGEVDAVRLGGGIGYGGFRFGGAVESNAGDAAADIGLRQRGFDVGASYDLGNFTTGFTWSRGFYRDFVTSGPATTSTDELSLSLSYRMGRGIDLIGALQFGESDSTAKAGRPDSSGSFIFGTAIRF